MKLDNFPTIPIWVNWLAQDEDGVWWGYSVEPLQHHCGWYENEVGENTLLFKEEPNTDWKQTLLQVPKIK